MNRMAHKDQWQREQEMRQITDGSKLDGSHVMEIVESFALDDKAIEYCMAHDELKGNNGTVYNYLVVMQAAVSDGPFFPP